MKQQIIARGAEAILIKKNNKLIKKRIKKGYRIREIDETLRRRRTKAEAKLLDKLEKEIDVPKILKVDEKNKEIIMEFISGLKLSEYLDSFPLKKQEKIMGQVGKEISKLHNLNIIHADLTTSNMILKEKENKVYLIDFGLSFHSSRIEDKAVDLHLLRQALEAKHFLRHKKLFKAVLSGYKSKHKKETLSQLKKVEKRGRYK
jgi:Kae1-associated kinase Bud32